MSTPIQPIADTTTIEHLDFTPSCTCEAHSLCGHRPGTECGDEAAFIVTVHLIHACNRAETDTYGNEVGPLCKACLDRLTAAVTDMVATATRIANRIGIVPSCFTCGCPVTAVSDIIRDVQPLKDRP